MPSDTRTPARTASPTLSPPVTASSTTLAQRPDSAFALLKGTPTPSGSNGPALLAFPNPVAYRLWLSLNLGQAEGVQVFLMDLRGRRVQSMDLGWKGPGTVTATLDVSRYASGIYFLTVLTNSGDGPRVLGIRKVAILR